MILAMMFYHHTGSTMIWILLGDLNESLLKTDIVPHAAQMNATRIENGI